MTLFKEHGNSLKSKWGKESHVTSDKPDASIKREPNLSKTKTKVFFIYSLSNGNIVSTTYNKF